MTSSHQFCLKWNNFTPKVCESLHELWQYGEHIDVTLVTSCKKFFAHRLLLCACSRFFRAALQSVPVSQTAVLLLPNVIEQDLEDLLQFIYTGEINIEEQRLDSLVNTANLLQIEGISSPESKSEYYQKENCLSKPPGKTNSDLEESFKSSKETILGVNDSAGIRNIGNEIEENVELNNIKVEVLDSFEEDLCNSEVESSFHESVPEAKISWSDPSIKQGPANVPPQCSNTMVQPVNAGYSSDQYQQFCNITRRNSYTAGFKLQVVQFAELNGKRAAASKFDVDESNVRLWCRTKDKLEKMPVSTKAARGASAFFPDLERRLEDWISDQRKEGHSVSTLQARMKAKLLATEMNITDFKASASWCSRFMSRKHLCVRPRKDMGQILPGEFEGKVAFHKFIIVNENE